MHGLPAAPYDEFRVSFDARFENRRQLYRMGFQQTSRYSHVLDASEDLPAQLSYNMRREVRLLQGDYSVDGQVSYGDDGAAPLVIVEPSGFFSEGVYLTEKRLPALPLPTLEGVPVLFGAPTVREKGGRLFVEADLIASASWAGRRRAGDWLSRWLRRLSGQVSGEAGGGACIKERWSCCAGRIPFDKRRRPSVKQAGSSVYHNLLRKGHALFVPILWRIGRLFADIPPKTCRPLCGIIHLPSPGESDAPQHIFTE